MANLSDFNAPLKYGAKLGDFANDGDVAHKQLGNMTPGNVKGWVKVVIDGTEYKIPAYDTIA